LNFQGLLNSGFDILFLSFPITEFHADRDDEARKETHEQRKVQRHRRQEEQLIDQYHRRVNEPKEIVFIRCVVSIRWGIFKNFLAVVCPRCA
jgi:hypothetical protein